MLLYSYQYAYLRLQTTTPIVGLIPDPNPSLADSSTPDLILQEAVTPHGALPPAAFRWSDRYGLSLHRLPEGWLFRTAAGSEFEVGADGRQLYGYPGNAGWSYETSDVFVRRVLPRVVQLHGRRVLHGAALARSGGAIILLGKSHVGKSTLATALSRRPGWQLLSDDDAVVACGSDPRVLPSSPSACLWEDSQAALASTWTTSEVLPAYGTKFRCDLRTAFTESSAPLRAVYLLDTWRPAADDIRGPQWEELPISHRLAKLVQQSIRFNPADLEEEAGRQRELFLIAARIPMAILRYPLRYDVFAEVAELLEAE